ncbi:hypothetical protein [Streptomyces sp. NPDC053541]|uniref:hypothetical protein n=1 Tax=Streptomyces sp. NPDC053541 TaxID=3365709 RepID=UPI0037D58D01
MTSGGDMRKWVSVAIAAGLFFGGASGAVAAGWHRLDLTTKGAAFAGEYAWEPKNKNHGGFHFRGYLQDSVAGDGHNVYILARVEAYPFSRYNGVQRRKDVHLDEILYDGAALYSSTADIRVCRDRGSLRPDNCSPTRFFRR